MKINIAIRTDGSKSLGNGHIVRMLALADELCARFIDFFLVVKHDDFWVNRIQEKYKVESLSGNNNEIDFLCEILTRNKVTHLVYDTRGDLGKDEIEYVSKVCKIKIIVIDTPEDTRLAADCVIYPPIPQVKEWNWDGFKGQLYSGWEYVLLRKDFLTKKSSLNPKAAKKILLSFGSTDPYLLTEQTIRAIANSGNWYESYEFILIVGPQFDRLDSIKKSDDFKSLNIKVYQGPPNIAELYSSVDLAFIAFGVTAYELASLEVPFMYISISEDHEKSGEIFDTLGIAANLGLTDSFTLGFKNKIELFLNNLNATNLNYQKNNFGSGICNWNEIIKVIIE